MEAKKTIKIIIILVLATVFVFLAVIWINAHIEKKEKLNMEQNLDFANPLAVNSYDLVVGNGPLDIIVYEDYNDTFSVEFAQTIDRLQNDFNGKIRVIYRFINSSNSDFANQSALAVNCAKDQGEGLAMRQALLVNTANNILNGEGIKLAAEKINLNQDRFADCLLDLKKKAKIESLNDLAESVPVYGTPTTFINREIILGARPYDTFIDSNGDEIEGLRQVVERHLN